MTILSATATEARQHFNRYVGWVERGGARVQIVRHQQIVAVLVSTKDAERLAALDEAEARKPEEPAASYSEKEREEIDRRIWDPAIRALMGLPPLSPAALEALRGTPVGNDPEPIR